MEGGGGGNAWPYYANEIAYATAYELALATGAEYCEGDFWPSPGKPLSETVRVPEYCSRYRQILAYGLGFKDAKSDVAKRIPAEFISITSRHLFRPWDGVTWPMNLAGSSSPDEVLAEMGYSFAGMGEEGLDGLTAPQEVLFYTPQISTEKGWRAVLEKVRSGQVHRLVVVAPTLREVITERLQRKPLREVFPEWDVEEDGQWAPVAGSPAIMGPHDKLEGGEPVASIGGQVTAVKRKVGEGWVYCLLFDATLPENAASAATTYRQLFSDFGISPHWTADAGVMVRLYQNQSGMLIAGVQSDEVRSWKGPKGTSDGFRPYHVSSSHLAKVRVMPNQDYAFLALPSGTRGKQAADADGMLSLKLNQTSHELFFILPADRAAELDSLVERKKIFDLAMTLNGLVPSPGP